MMLQVADLVDHVDLVDRCVAMLQFFVLFADLVVDLVVDLVADLVAD